MMDRNTLRKVGAVIAIILVLSMVLAFLAYVK
jgi:hypothetical protein